MDELQRVKRDLKRLRTALPPLPTPDTLYDDIVDDCRNVMRTIESLDELRNDIEYFYHSNLRYGELEREAQILELKAENCKLKLQSLRQHLRLLFSVVPILIATKAISALAWRAKMQEAQSYVMRDGQEKELLTSQKDIEVIVNDQLHGMDEFFFAAIREIRSSCLNISRDGLPPHRGAGVTLGVGLRCTAEVHPPVGSPKLRRGSTSPGNWKPS
ncbi:hypothetical protein Aduo_012658 [Ancylostoma duodenale]